MTERKLWRAVPDVPPSMRAINANIRGGRYNEAMEGAVSRLYNLALQAMADEGHVAAVPAELDSSILTRALAGATAAWADEIVVRQGEDASTTIQAAAAAFETVWEYLSAQDEPVEPGAEGLRRWVSRLSIASMSVGQSASTLVLAIMGAFDLVGERLAARQGRSTSTAQRNRATAEAWKAVARPELTRLREKFPDRPATFYTEQIAGMPLAVKPPHERLLMFVREEIKSARRGVRNRTPTFRNRSRRSQNRP